MGRAARELPIHSVLEREILEGADVSGDAHRREPIHVAITLGDQREVCTWPSST
jgi:hypothetical protein